MERRKASQPGLGRLRDGFGHPIWPFLLAYGVATITLLPSGRDFLGAYFDRPAVRIAGLLLLMTVGVALSARPNIRVGIVLILLSMMVTSATRFGERLPFESWGLYRDPAPISETVHFLDVVTDSQAALRVDDQLMGKFTSPSNHNRWARRVVEDMSNSEQVAFACFIVAKTREYVQARESGQSWIGRAATALSFPDHQFGFTWSDEMVAALGEPVGIRVRSERISLEESEDWKPNVIRRDSVTIPCS